MKEEKDIPRGWSRKELECKVGQRISRKAAQELVLKALNEFPKETEFTFELSYDGAFVEATRPETDEEYRVRVESIRKHAAEGKERRRQLWKALQKEFGDEEG